MFPRREEHVETALRLAEGQTAESRLIVKGEADDLLEWMRSQVAVPGSDFVRALCVVVPPRKAIVAHKHPEWTALFYARPADTPLMVEDWPLTPEPGDLLVLRPNVVHAVLKNETDEVRVSIAMLVDGGE